MRARVRGPVVALSIGPLWLRDADEARPVLSGPQETVEAGRFRLHFTRTGADAPPATDGDADGLPDVVNAVAEALPAAEAAYGEEGWRALVPDSGVGGSDTIDVYLHELPVFGYATPVPAADGEDGWSCFLQVDAKVGVAGSVAASVATHELHHCVEFRYRADAPSWLYEAAATYEQYSHVEDELLGFAAGVLYVERLSAPERRLAAVDGRFEYAGFLWMKYWSERDGFAPERLPALWEALARGGEQGEDWRDTLDREAQARFGAGLSATYLDFATWNAFACGNDVGAHYRGDPIPCVATEATVPIAAWDGEAVDLVHDQAPYTAAYLTLPTTSDRTAVRCDGQDGLRFAGIALDGDGRPTAGAVDADGHLELPTASGGSVRLVVAGTGDAPLDATCAEAPLEHHVGCSTAGAWRGAPAALLALVTRRRRGRSGRGPTPRRTRAPAG